LHARVVEATGLPFGHFHFKAYVDDAELSNPTLNWNGEVDASHKTTDPLWDQSHTFEISKKSLSTGSLIIEIYQKQTREKCCGECKFDLNYFNEKKKDKRFAGWLCVPLVMHAHDHHIQSPHSQDSSGHSNDQKGTDQKPSTPKESTVSKGILRISTLLPYQKDEVKEHKEEEVNHMKYGNARIYVVLQYEENVVLGKLETAKKDTDMALRRAEKLQLISSKPDSRKLLLYLATFNCGNAPLKSLFDWVPLSKDIDIYVIGCQECKPSHKKEKEEGGGEEEDEENKT